MNADNDLERFALQDLQEMMQVGSRAGFNIVVEVDRHPAHQSGSIGGLPDFSDTKRVKVMPGRLQVLQEMGEVDLAAPQALASFVTWGMQTFPADRTAIIFWDHGSGWSGFGVDETTGQNELLTLPEIEQGLRSGLGNRKVELLGFDACLMANYETALTLSPFGRYLLASEETEPGHGWDWNALSLAAQTPSTDAVALGARIIQDYRAHAKASTPSGDLTITLSLVDLNAISALKQAVQAFSQAVVAGGEARLTRVARARESTLSYQSDSGDPSRDLHLYDLGDLVGKAAVADTGLQGVAAQVQQALSQVVKVNLAGSARAGSSGLTIFFPPGSAYMSSQYMQLAGATEWRAFLQSTFTSAAIVPTFSAARQIFWSDTGEYVRVSSPLTAGASGSISQATLFYGLVINNGMYLLGQETASVSSSEAMGLWDRSVLVATQGSTSVYAYSNIGYGDGYASLNIDFIYQASPSVAAQYCIRQLVFQQTATGYTQAADRYFVINGGAWGELTPAVGSTLNPIVRKLNVDAQGQYSSQYVLSAQTPFVASNAGDGTGVFTFDLEFKPIAKGTQAVVALDVRNANNAGDFIAGAGALP
jgi:hypothetical protein